MPLQVENGDDRCVRRILIICNACTAQTHDREIAKHGGLIEMGWLRRFNGETRQQEYFCPKHNPEKEDTVGIELKIVAESVADLNNQLALLLNGAPIIVDVKTTEGGQAVEAPKKPTRTRKAEPANADTAEATSESSSGDDGATSTTSTTATTDASPSDDPAVEYADVQKAVTGLAAAKGRDAVLKVYESFGIDHATKLKPEQYAAAVAELDKAKEAA